MKCLNCENDFQGNFCNQCGQKSLTQKITLFGVLSDTFKMITNTDRGLWYSFINLTLRPGKTIISFLEGKRKDMLPPVHYVILGLTLLILVDNYFGATIPQGEKINELAKVYERGKPFAIGNAIGKLMAENLKYFLLINVVFFAIPAKLFFKKFTFAEHVTVQAFILGHTALITVLFFPLLNWPILKNPVFLLTLFLMTIATFFRKKEAIESILAVFFIVIIGPVLFFLVAIISFLIINKEFL